MPKTDVQSLQFVMMTARFNDGPGMMDVVEQCALFVDNHPDIRPNVGQ